MERGRERGWTRGAAIDSERFGIIAWWHAGRHVRFAPLASRTRLDDQLLNLTPQRIHIHAVIRGQRIECVAQPPLRAALACHKVAVEPIDGVVGQVALAPVVGAPRGGDASCGGELPLLLTAALRREVGFGAQPRHAVPV